MGIKGFNDVPDDPAFMSDVLRIEVTVPVGLHLTVVDLPGLISKPDLINEGMQKRIALLAKYEYPTKLKLGFFLGKNPTPSEIESATTSEQRRRAENRYFQSHPMEGTGFEDGACEGHVTQKVPAKFVGPTTH